MKVKVKVPATTANLGPGFDCLGLALPIYNEVTLEETVMPGSGIEIKIENDRNDDSVLFVPTDENNIVYKAIELLYNSIGMTPSELKITINTKIPLARGLGSSASVIVGGLLAANSLLGNPADEAAILSIATEVEGHPDNVVPCIVGGFVASSQRDDGSIFYNKMQWPQKWNLSVCIPDFELQTDISRSVLANEVSRKDAIFNIQHVAMLIASVYEQNDEMMKFALQDRLHQPFREKLVPGFKEIQDKLKFEENVLGCVLSGAGPSVLVISKEKELNKIEDCVSEIWQSFNIKSEILHLQPVETGAQIIE